MSNAVVEWARRQVTGDPRRKSLLMALANYADQDGYAWPSIERLQHDTELSIQVIRNVLRELAEINLIARHPDVDAAQQRYRVDVIKLRPTDDDDPAMLCILENTPKPHKGKIKKVKTAKATDEQFEVFWRNYPNQIGPGAAKKKFITAINSGKVTFEALLDGLESYINKTDDRAWCLPATWLEQERWADGRVDMKVSNQKGPSRPAI